MSRFSRLAAAMGLVFALAACSKNPLSPTHEGRPVVALDDAARWGLVWSPRTGEMLTMFGAEDPALVAIDARTGAMRTIDSDGTDFRLALSADGSSLFYNRRATDSTRAMVASLDPPGQARPLSASSRLYELAAQAPAGLVAYGLDGGGAMILHDLATDERRQVAEGNPLLFSPDGRLVYATSTSLQVYSNGISTPAGLPQPPLYDYRYPLAGPRLRWDARGLRTLYVTEDQHRLMYAAPFETPRTIAVIGSQNSSIWIEHTSLVWSRSGRTAALWCHRSGEGTTFWHDLYFIDIEARLHDMAHLVRVRRVTTARGYTNGFVDGRLAISPDDTRLYADIGRTLYEFSMEAR